MGIKKSKSVKLIMDKELFSYCHAMKISCTSNNPLVLLQLTVHTSLNYTQKRLQLSLVFPFASNWQINILSTKSIGAWKKKLHFAKISRGNLLWRPLLRVRKRVDKRKIALTSRYSHHSSIFSLSSKCTLHYTRFFPTSMYIWCDIDMKN